MMDIDPRLRPATEDGRNNNNNNNNNNTDSSKGQAVGTHTFRNANPSISSRQQGRTMSSSSGMVDYPDPPFHVASSSSSSNQPRHGRTADASSRGRGYYATNAQTYTRDATMGGTQSVFSTDPNNPFAEMKRPRACEACRQLKVRCEQDQDQDPDNPTCKRCAKAGRVCVVTMPTRKRQKKTDSRVAELERKIDALTANLQASRVPPAEVSPSSTVEHPGRRWLGNQAQRAPSISNNAGSPASLAGNKRGYGGEVKDSASEYLPPMYHHPSSLSLRRVHSNPSPPQLAKPSYLAGVDMKAEPSYQFADVIDRGVVDAETADKAFNRYVNDMAPHLPAVVFPPGTMVGDIRRAKPTLFHAIIAVSIGPIKPSVQHDLMHELYKLLAERVFVKAEKALELVQALLITYIWYDPPDRFEQLKFYQLSHMAVILAMDLGMCRRTGKTRKQFSISKDIMGRKPFLIDPDAAETRRTWLSCYFTSVMSSVALRRVLLVRWQPYMDECIEILESSQDALPSDRMLIHCVKLCHLMEDVGSQFLADYPCSSVSLSDPKIQYALRFFEKRLDEWKKELPPQLYSPLLAQFENILSIHIHEVAMHIESEGDSSNANDEDIQNCPTSAIHINALTNSLTAIHAALEITISLDMRSMLSLPTVSLARTSYAAVSLIKLYSYVSSRESIGQVLDPASLKVEYYLDRIIEHYKAAGELEGGRTPARFSIVLSMLRNWFMKRKEQGTVVKENMPCMARANGKDVDAAYDEGGKVTTNQTPLHLLSEVAMGEPNNRTDGQGQTQLANPPPNFCLPATGVSDAPSAPSDHLLQRVSASTSAPTAASESDGYIHFSSPLTASHSITGSRSFYPHFNPQQQQQQQQQEQEEQVQELSGYANGVTSAPGNLLMASIPPPPMQTTGFISDPDAPGLIDPENLYALGSIVDERIFGYGLFPFDGDGNGNATGTANDNWFLGLL